MKTRELLSRLRAFLELEGCRLEAADPDATAFTVHHPSTGLTFVFSLPGEPDHEVGETGLELHVILPLVEWTQVRAESAGEVLDLLACQDTLPGSVNALGYVRGPGGEPDRITLQGGTGLQQMDTEDEKDVRLLLESLALDSLDVMGPLYPHLKHPDPEEA